MDKLSRIAKHTWHHPWASRDYEEIDCKATGCMFNKDEKCMVPSRCKIGDDGRCKGFTIPPDKKGEVVA